MGDHFIYSHDLNVRFRGDIVRRNLMLITPRGKTVKVFDFTFVHFE